jgi:ParB family chromosome partitioning protein
VVIVLAKDLKEILAALGEDADLLTFVEGPDAIGIRSKKFLERDKWRGLNEAIQELGGTYSSEKRGWIVQLEKEKPKPTPAGQGRLGGKDPYEGLTPDLKRRAIEADAEHEKTAAEELTAGKIMWASLSSFHPNKYNPNEMTPEEYAALGANMIKEGPHGTDPLTVRPDGMGFEIIDGEHRWKKAGELKWERIRYVVREVDEDRAQEINYAKNKLRGHINPWKEAELFSSAWSKFKTQEVVAKKFGVTQPYVADALSLLKVPDEVREIIARAIIQPSSRVLRILASLEDPTDQEALAMEIANGITVREAEDFVKNLETGGTISLGKPEEKAKDVVLELVDGEEEVVLASQISKVKAVKRPPDARHPGVDWRVEYRESGVLCSSDVTEECGLELERMGFPVERIELQPEKSAAKSPQTLALPCDNCNNDSEKGGDCSRERVHVDNVGNLICEFQNKPLETTDASAHASVQSSVPSSVPTKDIDEEIKGALRQPAAASSTEKKPKELDLHAQYRFCPVCGSPKDKSVYERLKKKFAAFIGLFPEEASE